MEKLSLEEKSKNLLDEKFIISEKLIQLSENFSVYLNNSIEINKEESLENILKYIEKCANQLLNEIQELKVYKERVVNYEKLTIKVENLQKNFLEIQNQQKFLEDDYSNKSSQLNILRKTVQFLGEQFEKMQEKGYNLKTKSIENSLDDLIKELVDKQIFQKHTSQEITRNIEEMSEFFEGKSLNLDNILIVKSNKIDNNNVIICEEVGAFLNKGEESMKKKSNILYSRMNQMSCDYLELEMQIKACIHETISTLHIQSNNIPQEKIKDNLEILMQLNNQQKQLYQVKLENFFKIMQKHKKNFKENDEKLSYFVEKCSKNLEENDKFLLKSSENLRELVKLKNDLFEWNKVWEENVSLKDNLEEKEIEIERIVNEKNQIEGRFSKTVESLLELQTQMNEHMEFMNKYEEMKMNYEKISKENDELKSEMLSVLNRIKLKKCGWEVLYIILIFNSRFILYFYLI